MDNKIRFEFMVPGMIEIKTVEIEDTKVNRHNMREIEYQLKLQLAEKYLVGDCEWYGEYI
ncbi:hypothetical protein [Clostridium estertheticum]|uniref:hypothetical protein n=1 Tax=Clostridium estertheticum TaxID=238834 RepID=UPI001C7CBB67|nr:hypothetical protein [Clostridium estertheticum]MBX4266558.1 hypothetical protein [Clostridium estertheticum]WLC88102.1 hypothetical protein KTC95_19105 [Clostridium estertheticum]